MRASCHGTDNADALRRAGELTRGIAFVGATVTDVELEERNGSGVCGVSFNFLKRLGDATPRADLSESSRESCSSAGSGKPSTLGRTDDRGTPTVRVAHDQ